MKRWKRERYRRKAKKTRLLASAIILIASLVSRANRTASETVSRVHENSVPFWATLGMPRERKRQRQEDGDGTRGHSFVTPFLPWPVQWARAYFACESHYFSAKVGGCFISTLPPLSIREKFPFVIHKQWSCIITNKPPSSHSQSDNFYTILCN